MPNDEDPIQHAGASSGPPVPVIVLATIVALAWVSGGTTPFQEAARGALDPVDFARDYVTARARLEDGRGAPPPEGEAGNARAARYGAPEVLLYGAYYHAHPPPARLPARPFGFLRWRTAALLWAAGSLVALAWLAASLLRIAARGQPPSGARVAVGTLALALWPPVLHCFEKGQWSILLAALLAGGLVDLERGRPRRAGALLGLAAALKVTPIVLLGLLALRFRRAALAMAATLATCLAASLAVDGLAPWRAFLGGAAQNAAVWAPWTANTASLAGVYARLFGGPGPFARPLLAAPALATGLFDASALALLATALLALRARPAAVGSAPVPAPTLAAWLALPVLLNPLGWSHVLIMLLAPLTVAARDGGRRTRTLVLVTLAAFTVPRQTLAALAGPLPVGPARGLVLGLHAAAALILFAILLRESLATRRAGPPTPTASSHY